MISGMASERGNRQKEIGKKAARIVLSACVWLAAWQVLSSVVGKEVLFASPYATFTRLFSLLGTGGFWLKTLRSLLGITEGYLLGICGGVLLAVLTACSEWLYAVFKPMLTVIKTTPVVSFIILALVWLQKESVPIFISFLMVLPIIWANLATGIAQTDPQLLEMARVYGFSKHKILRYVYFPSALPSLLTALTTAIGFAWKAGIAAEVISTPRDSIGAQLNNAKVYLETADLFAWTLVVILLSMAFERLIVFLVGKISAYAAKEGAV